MTTLLLVIIYVAFISLGLPDALLGSAWPVMQPELHIPFGYAGIFQMIISGGTIVSSVYSSRVIRKFGTGRVTAVSVFMTAAALLGFALSPGFWWIAIAAIPLGLGAGAVDSALNAYVAVHYESRHMSWLHSFWGLGALSGPLILSLLLSGGFSWRRGYLSIGVFQSILVVVLLLSLPLWTRVKTRLTETERQNGSSHQKSLFFPLKIRGVSMALITFFFYCGIELTVGLWGSSYLVKVKELQPATAASWVSLFYASITIGRFLTGFVTFRLSNAILIRSGGITLLVGIVLLLMPLSPVFSLVAYLLIGFGCAPIFPCMLHETPVNFGASDAQAVMGFQMASAYVGATFLPPLFGFVASSLSMTLFPWFLLGYILLLLLGAENLKRVAGKTVSGEAG